MACASVPLAPSQARVHRSIRIRVTLPHSAAGLHPSGPVTSSTQVPTGETTPVAVKIRLKRLGKIRSPHFRIVVMDARAKRDGRAIEEIGLYHPKNDPSVIKVNSERAQYWLSVGAQPTEAVIAILKRTGDWQKFSGDTSPSGVDPQPEPVDKVARFNAALAEVADEPSSSAISKSKKAKKDEAKAEPEAPQATEPEAAAEPEAAPEPEAKSEES